MQSIYKYISLSSFLLCLAVLTTQSQENKVEKTQEKKKESTLPKVKLLNGFTVQVDVASLLTTALIHGDSYSMEAGVQFDLKKKYYPIVELGFAGADKISNENVGFKTNGLFGRVGVDINLIKPKKDSKPTNNLFLLGARLGMTNFAYDITNVKITDNYWGGTESPDYMNQKSTKVWFEIVAGVRVEVYKNVYMGWTVRNKNLLGQDAAGKVFPWYIPGFGINTSNNWGVNYTVGYHF
ncbi:MAG TPA: DUF6048 family protein [Paludibacter sp.]